MRARMPRPTSSRGTGGGSQFTSHGLDGRIDLGCASVETEVAQQHGCGKDRGGWIALFGLRYPVRNRIGSNMDGYSSEALMHPKRNSQVLKR